MSDIQQARDVLAKWRENSTTGRWAVTSDGYVVLPTAPIAHFIDVGTREEVSPLIVGTAGNPELLDAIDEVLRVSLSLNSISPAVDFVAHRFTKAIIAADERMSA